MMIQRIEIYGYGKIQQESITLEPGVTYIFGENEAGKTTWMEFIRHVLFGFPTKKERERQYIPKKGGVCGGYLLVKTEKYGVLKIERVLSAQRVTGDVTISDASGKKLASTVLDEVLDGMDEDTFQSIYHFGLDGLRLLHQKKGEDFSKYLFATAMFGEKNSANFLDEQEKKMKERFKPRGKSKISDGLDHLRVNFEALCTWEEKEDSYYTLLTEREHIRTKKETALQEKRKIEQKIADWKQVVSLQPIQDEQILLKKEMIPYENIQNISEEELSMMENCFEEKKQMEASFARIHQEKRQIEISAEGASCDYAYYVHYLPFMEDVQALEEMERTLSDLEKQLLKNEEEATQLRTKLGTDFHESMIYSLPDNFIHRESLKQYVENREVLTKDLKQEKDACYELKQKIQEKRTQIQHLKEKQQHFPTKEQIEEQLEVGKKLAVLKEKEESCYAQIQMLRANQSGRNEKRPLRFNKNVWFFVMGIFVAVVGMIFSLIENHLFFGVLFILLSLLLIVFAKRDKHTDENASMLQFLQSEYAHIQKNIAQLENLYPLISEAQLKNEKQQLERLTQEIFEREAWCARLEEEWQYKNRTVQKLLDAHHDYTKEIQQLFCGIGWENFSISSHAVSYLDLCFSLKFILERNVQLENQINQTRQAYTKCLTHWLNETPNVNLERKTLEQLKNVWTQRREIFLRKMAQQDVLCETYANLLLQEKGYQEKLERCMQKVTHLCDGKPWKNETQFHTYKADLQKKQSLQKQMINLENQMQHFLQHNRLDESLLWHIDRASSEIELLQVHLEELITTIRLLSDELEHIGNQIYEIEAGSQKDNSRNHYAYTKGLVYEDMKEWLILAEMRDQFQTVWDVLKKEKMPRMLEEASEIFSYVTNGAYKEITVDESSQLFIVCNDENIWFAVEELSRGTKEQLYMALRFALALCAPFQVKFLLVLDDPFVNFDGKRMNQALHAIRHMSKERQVIYFTCKTDIVERVEEKGMHVVKI